MRKTGRLHDRQMPRLRLLDSRVRPPSHVAQDGKTQVDQSRRGNRAGRNDLRRPARFSLVILPAETTGLYSRAVSARRKTSAIFIAVALRNRDCRAGTAAALVAARRDRACRQSSAAIAQPAAME